MLSRFTLPTSFKREKVGFDFKTLLFRHPWQKLSLPTLPKTAYDSPEKKDDYDESVQSHWEFVGPNYGYAKDSISHLTRPPSFEDDNQQNVEAVPYEDHTQLAESQAQTTTVIEDSQPVANSNPAFDAQAVYPAEACLFVAK